MLLTKASINALPVDLLSSIFVLWASVDEDGPWMASSVCKEWRRIVLACPTAWSHISVILKPPSNVTPEDRAWCVEEDDLDSEHSPRGKRRPLDLWFLRSGRTRLNLTLTVASTHPHIEARLAECLTLLRAHPAGLRTLRVDVESVLLADAFFSELPPCDLDELALQIMQTPRRGWLRGAHASGEGSRVPALWRGVRSVRHALLDGCMPPRRADGTGGETRSLVLGGISVTPELLADYSALTTLELREAPAPAHATPLVLPALARLTLQRTCMESAAGVCRWLRAPALTHLALGNGGVRELALVLRPGETTAEATAEFGGALARFVAAAPGLVSLRLSRSSVHDRHVVEVLRNAPSLVELRIEECLVGAPFLRALTLPVGASSAKPKPPVCPNLQSLSFHKCDLVPGEQLVALVRSRNHADSPTSRITDVRTLRCPNVSVSHVHDLLNAL